MAFAEGGTHTARSMIALSADGDIRRYLALSAEGEADNLPSALKQSFDQVKAISRLTEERLHEAQRLAIPVLLSAAIDTDEATVSLIPPARARQLRAVPLLQANGRLAVAMENPVDARVLEQLDFIARQRVVALLASPDLISDLLAHRYDRLEDIHVIQELGLDPNTHGREAGERENERLARERSVVRIINELLREALAQRASDVHLRPAEDGLELLYRIDGSLVPVRRFLPALAPALISRIKVLGQMNLAEHRRPQDGRASFSEGDGNLADMRISIMPTVWGEGAVIRLLNTTGSLKDIDALGFSPRDRALIQRVLERSHGMFLATGPTGCGKSTTLYALLLELRRSAVNILTVEDPVEFHIPGLQQMQVNHTTGFSFASALRNMLRHDPDVIMVGEIRDRETASIAVDAALTGHLVLSTLHTNTAATTLTRLLDLGVESYLLRSSMLAVLAQRLVKRNCPHCREADTVEPHIVEALGVDPAEVFLRGRGCSACGGRGVHGRRSVHELMEITPEIRRLIVPGADADAIHEAALSQGMHSITQSGIALARDGEISLSEAYRVRTD